MANNDDFDYQAQWQCNGITVDLITKLLRINSTALKASPVVHL